MIGNLGREPEMKYLPSGQPVTSFSIASNRKYTTNGERREETEWFNVPAWGKSQIRDFLANVLPCHAWCSLVR